MALFLETKNGWVNADFVRWINKPWQNEKSEWLVYVEFDKERAEGAEQAMHFESEKAAWNFVEAAVGYLVRRP